MDAKNWIKGKWIIRIAVFLQENAEDKDVYTFQDALTNKMMCFIRNKDENKLIQGAVLKKLIKYKALNPKK